MRFVALVMTCLISAANALRVNTPSNGIQGKTISYLQSELRPAYPNRPAGALNASRVLALLLIAHSPAAAFNSAGWLSAAAAAAGRRMRLSATAVRHRQPTPRLSEGEVDEWERAVSSLFNEMIAGGKVPEVQSINGKHAAGDERMSASSKTDHDEDGSKQLTTYYINLANRADRRKHFEDQANQLGLTFTRFEALTGKDVDDSIVGRRWQPGLNAKYSYFQYPDAWHELSDGERGCAGSHVMLWKTCVFENRPMLVLEDDAVFEKGFLENYRAAMSHISEHDPTLLFLQCQVKEWGDYRRNVTADTAIGDVKYSWQTAAYVIWPETAAKLLRHLPICEPVDVFLSCLTYSGDIRAYACDPKIISQCDAGRKEERPFAKSDVEHTGDEPMTIEESLRHNLDKYSYNWEVYARRKR